MCGSLLRRTHPSDATVRSACGTRLDVWSWLHHTRVPTVVTLFRSTAFPSSRAARDHVIHHLLCGVTATRSGHNPLPTATGHTSAHTLHSHRWPRAFLNDFAHLPRLHKPHTGRDQVAVLHFPKTASVNAAAPKGFAVVVIQLARTAQPRHHLFSCQRTNVGRKAGRRGPGRRVIQWCIKCWGRYYSHGYGWGWTTYHVRRKHYLTLHRTGSDAVHRDVPFNHHVPLVPRKVEQRHGTARQSLATLLPALHT